MAFQSIAGGAFGIALNMVTSVASRYSSKSTSDSTPTNAQTTANRSNASIKSTPSKPTPPVPALKKDTVTISSTAYSLQSKNIELKNVQQTVTEIKNMKIPEIKIAPIHIKPLNFAPVSIDLSGLDQTMARFSQTMSDSKQSITTFNQGVQGVGQATQQLKDTANTAYQTAVQSNRTLSNVGQVDIHNTVPSHNTTVNSPSKRTGDTSQMASSIMDLVPIVGNVKAGQEVLTGTNLVTNQPLSSGERVVALAGVIGGPLVKVIDKAMGIGKTAITTQKITKDVSEINKAIDIANNYKLSDDRYYNHILVNHGPNSMLANKSKFKAGFDIKQGIDQTLKSPDMYMRENTNGRDGFVFYKDFSIDIGKSNGKDVNRLRVATDASGNVLTAFPEKSK